MPPKIKPFKIHICWLFIIPLVMCMILFTLYTTNMLRIIQTLKGSQPRNITIVDQPKFEPILTLDTTATIRARDRMVDEDRLYPPYDRNTMGIAKQYLPEKLNGTFNMATRESNDEFRLIGYLSNNGSETDQGGNTWKLYARETHRGSGAAEFYVIPANRNYDIKLFINNNMLQSGSERLKGVYDIPSSLSFNHAMFSKASYHLELLPKSDLQSQYV